MVQPDWLDPDGISQHAQPEEASGAAVATCTWLGQLSLSCQTQRTAISTLTGGHPSAGLDWLPNLLLHWHHAAEP